MGQVLDISMQKLERVVYFSSYIITSIDEGARKNIIENIDKEYESKVRAGRKEHEGEKDKKKLNKIIKDLNRAKAEAKREVNALECLKVISEIDYQELSLKYGEVFDAETGSEALKKIFEKFNFKEEIDKLKKILESDNKINLKKLLRRRNLLEKMREEGVRPEWMFFEVIPVLPPGLRPMVQLDGGRFAASDLNDLTIV